MFLTETLTRMLVVTASALACVVVCGGTNALLDDAHCQLKQPYFGDIDGDPPFEPCEPESEEDIECVTTACPTSGNCQVVKTFLDSPPGETWTTYHCACPSGGGADGCHGTATWKLNSMGGTISFEFTCGGSCDSPEVCDFHSMTAPVNPPHPNPTPGEVICQCQ